MQELAVDTLDHQLERHGLDDVDFIKVDTQGSELFVLQGASQVLGQHVVGVEVEVEFASIYGGQPLFADVDRHMREHGFDLFDLRRVTGSAMRASHSVAPTGRSSGPTRST